jgi:hypothetical protein
MLVSWPEEDSEAATTVPLPVVKMVWLQLAGRVC